MLESKIGIGSVTILKYMEFITVIISSKPIVYVIGLRSNGHISVFIEIRIFCAFITFVSVKLYELDSNFCNESSILTK